MRPFVPFDEFEHGCAPASKSLHETMQENCIETLQPDEPERYVPCVPHWHPTGESTCLSIGLIAITEQNGCGQTRQTRTLERVVWEATAEARCDELNNRIQIQQVNQCGDTRWINVNELCCKPAWVVVPDGEINCDQTNLRREEADGCGNTRMRRTNTPVDWVSTGNERCDTGNIYQIERVNQCGDVQWITIPGGCPCIPNWTMTGNERCVNRLIEQEEVDGCGSTRWIRTEFPCSNSPPANPLSTGWLGELLSGKAMDGPTNVYVRLEVETGQIVWGWRDYAPERENWVSGAFDRNDYEARITLDQGIGYDIQVSGSDLNTWFDLGDITIVNVTLSIIGAFSTDTVRRDVIIRVDIRKKGEGISGGKTFGPFTMQTT